MCFFAGRSTYLFHYLVQAQKGPAASMDCWQVKATRIFIVYEQVFGFQLHAKHLSTELMTDVGNKRWQFPKRAQHKCWHGDWQRQLGPIKFSAVPDKIWEWECIFGRWTRESWLSSKALEQGSYSRIFSVVFSTHNLILLSLNIASTQMPSLWLSNWQWLCHCVLL